MNWATVTTQCATAWIHKDTEGFATTVQPLTGLKYWVIFTRDPSVGPYSMRGDLGTTSFAPPLAQFQDHDLKGWMNAEAILLGPGDMLYVPSQFLLAPPLTSVAGRIQRPNTLHYVVTIENCVTIGRHLYPTASIQASVHAVTHILARRGTNTNQIHLDTRVMMRRLLTSWVEWHLHGNWDAGQCLKLT
jgi:hypothetical protein